MTSRECESESSVLVARSDPGAAHYCWERVDIIYEINRCRCPSAISIWIEDDMLAGNKDRQRCGSESTKAFGVNARAC